MEKHFISLEMKYSRGRQICFIFQFTYWNFTLLLAWKAFQGIVALLWFSLCHRCLNWLRCLAVWPGFAEQPLLPISQTPGLGYSRESSRVTLHHGHRKCSEDICETKWNMAPSIYTLCKRKPQGDVSRDTPALIFPGHNQCIICKVAHTAHTVLKGVPNSFRQHWGVFQDVQMFH